MVKIEELRIGNIIKGFQATERKVVGILDDGQIYTADLVNGEFTIEPIRDIEPIPLTPEILKKAGFDKDTLGYVNGSKFSLYYHHKNNNGKYMAFWRGVECGSPFKYLHQLQNLYFALAGEELNITP